MVTRYGQADIPREVSSHWADHRSTPPLTSRGMSAVSGNHKVFLLSSTYILDAESKIIVLTVLWNEKYSDLMTNYLSILVWRRLPSELTSPAKWRRRAEGPTLCWISQGLHLAHKKPEYKYGFIPYLVMKKITSKSPVLGCIYCRLTPCFRRHFAMFADSSQVRACCSIVQMNG